MKKSIIALAILPLFALTACTEEENTVSDFAQEQNSNLSAVANPASVAQTADGSFAGTELVDSYTKAKEQGYTGTIEEWAALVNLQQTDPVAAQKVAEASGFSGGEMLLGALAGAAVGALAVNAMSSRTGMASNTYSQQRTNNATNYAYSQPDDRDRRTTGGGGAVAATSSSSSNFSNTSRPATMPAATASRPSVTSSAISRPSVAVSRGGFGGAVSTGG